MKYSSSGRWNCHRLGIVGDAAVQGKAAESPTMSQILLNIVPTNPAESLAKGDVLPIIFFAVLFGLAIAYVKDSCLYVPPSLPCLSQKFATWDVASRKSKRAQQRIVEG